MRPVGRCELRSSLVVVDADELFERWRGMLERGKFVTAEVLCKGHPELLPEMERRIQAYAVEELGTRIDPAEDAPAGPPPPSTFIETHGLGPITTPPSSRTPSETTVEPVREESSKPGTGDSSSEPPESGATAASDDDSPTEDVRIHAVSSFERFRLLARGGLGEVFVAGDQEFHRDVVLKFIRREHEGDEATRAQFELEAEITARLEHPGVVPMYAIGRTTEGRTFQVMRYIRGESLEERIALYHRSAADIAPAERNIEFRFLLARFASVCQTIAYAHSRGIVHRDVKPENVMLGKYGETLVVDWGLAISVRRREEDRRTGEVTMMPSSGSGESSDGMIAGTPCYMSPEQANGSGDLGPPSDVYGLGAVLYKLLTGRLAYPGSNVSDVLKSVRRGEFEPPRSRDPHVPAALEAICLKAMQADPRQRYTTALEMAEDVEAYLAGERVSAHGESWTARTGRWLRRHERAARTLATLLLAAVVGASVWATSAVLHQRRAIEQRVESLETQANLYESLLQRGLAELRGDVRLLATRPDLRNLLRLANEGGIDEIARVPVSVLFEEFLDLNPDYLEVRLIGADGREIVRIDRSERGAPPAWIDEYRDRSDRPYFTGTRALSRGQVHLSPIDVSLEDGRHQWDTPVIRAGTPVYGDDRSFLGIVVVNLHFEHLTELVHGDTERVDLVLTNGRGEFLDHPVRDVAFSFERGLDLPIDAVHPYLGSFLQTESRSFSRRDVVPRSVVVVSATSTDPAAGETVTTFAESIRSDPAFKGVEVLVSDYGDEDTGFEGNDARTIVAFVGIAEARRDDLLERARDLGEAVRVGSLPVQEGRRHAVHARKIAVPTDGRPHDLVLVMSLAY